jgi:hypothetical protein
MRSVFIFGKQGALTRAVAPVALSLGVVMAFPAAALNLNLGGSNGVSVGIGGSGGGLSVDANLGGESGVSAGITAGGGSVAGVDASVGGSSGLNASVGVGDGSLLEADVSLGGGGTPSPGPGPGPGPGPAPGPGDVIDGVRTEAISAAQLAAAKRVRCRRDGNSTSYNGFVAFDPQGVGLGVVQDASVSADLTLERLRISTIPRDGLPSTCVLILAPQARIGNGAMIVQANWAQVSGSIPR